MLFWIFNHTAMTWIYDAIFIIYICTLLSILVFVVSENRNPVKSLSWVTVLLLLPVVGIILYLIFGRNIRNTKKLSRRLRRLLKKCDPDINFSLEELNLSNEAIQQIRLGNSLAGAHFFPGNKVDVFTCGNDMFNRFVEDLQNAGKYINIEYYIFNDDTIGTKIADILIQKAKNGLPVRVIYDYIGSIDTKNKFFNRLRQAGVEIYPFYKVHFPWIGSPINWRNHRKLCVIDGNVGYLGGMNIADRYIDGGKEFRRWRDTHVRVEGPIISAMENSFAYDWHFMDKPLIIDPVDTRIKGDVGAQLVTSGPTGQWPNMAYMLHRAICNANRRVFLQTPYFLPTDPLLKALITASLSGVDVRVMLPRRCDSAILNYASFSFIGECLQAGIKVYFYEPGMLHAKMIVVDDDISTIGSTNFDFRSFEHNFEANLFFYSKEFNARCTEIFTKDLEDCSRVYADEWKRRPLKSRILECIFRLISPIL